MSDMAPVEPIKVGDNIFCWQLFDMGQGSFLIVNTMTASKQYLLEATEKGMQMSALAKNPDSLMPEIMRMFCERAFAHLMKGEKK